MTSQRVQIQGVDIARVQGAQSQEAQALTAQRNDLRMRMSDLRVRISQLQDAKANAHEGLKVDQQYAQQIRALEQEHTRALIDFESVQSRLASLEAPTAVTITPPPPPQASLIGPEELKNFSIIAFLLLLPMSIAMARRIWLRSTPAKQPVLNVEASPRMQRMEEAIESIAVEVERIGEAQRFATKLLAERRVDEVANRIPMAPSQRTPGTITPH